MKKFYEDLDYKKRREMLRFDIQTMLNDWFKAHEGEDVSYILERDVKDSLEHILEDMRK
jgi:hypothetical protein